MITLSRRILRCKRCDLLLLSNLTASSPNPPFSLIKTAQFTDTSLSTRLTQTNNCFFLRRGLLVRRERIRRQQKRSLSVC